MIVRGYYMVILTFGAATLTWINADVSRLIIVKILRNVEVKAKMRE